MSGLKTYQKSLKEAGKFKRLEIEVLLSRYLETFEFESGSIRKPDINVNELSDVLFSLYALTQTPPQSSAVNHAQLISDKEIDTVFKILTFIIKDGRQHLVIARTLCESILINTGFFRDANLGNLSDEQLLHCLDFLAPKTDYKESIKRLVAIFNSNRYIDPNIRFKCVSFLTRAIVSVYLGCVDEVIDEKNASAILDWMIETLQNTEVIQPTQMYFLGDHDIPSSEKKALKLVTELDGSPCRDQFTVLNTGKFLSLSQQIHIEIMPLLKPWLQICANFTAEDSSVIGKVMNYIGRLLDQIEINVRNPSNKAVVYSCLSFVLDLLLCGCCEKFVPQFYLRCSTLYQQSVKGELPPSISVKLCRFLTKHADTMGKNAQQFFNNIFLDILSQKYSNSDFCNEIMILLLSDAQESSLKISCAARYFPNIFKILIWNPRAYLSEFVELLPFIFTPSNCLELFYYLVDLPCVAATMDLCKKLSSPSQNISLLKQIWDNPINQQYFSFLMRKESGKMGDTLSKIENIHDALKPLTNEPRVSYSYDVATEMLTSYFTLIVNSTSVPSDKISDFVPIILDRSAILYGSQSYKSAVLSIFGNSLYIILKNNVSLIFHHFDDIHSYISDSSKIISCQSVYLALLYIVSSNEVFSCDLQVECMSRLYDTLECLVYEILSSDVAELSVLSIPIAFWSLLITCISRIASVIQDLIPRCSLVLSKIKQNLCHKSSEEQLRCLSLKIDEFSQLLSQNNLGRNILANPVLQQSISNFDKSYFTTVLKTIDLIMDDI